MSRFPHRTDLLQRFDLIGQSLHAAEEHYSGLCDRLARCTYPTDRHGLRLLVNDAAGSLYTLRGLARRHNAVASGRGLPRIDLPPMELRQAPTPYVRSLIELEARETMVAAATSRRTL